MTDALPADHQIGANKPPADAPDPFTALSVHAADLRIEGGKYCDGQKIKDAAEMAVVQRLIDDVKDALDAVAEARDAEIKPLSEKVTAIREKFYVLDGETKKITGSLILMKKALLAAKTDWGNRENARIAAETAAANKRAQEAAAIAAQAVKDAAGDIEAAEKAEALVHVAQDAQREVRQVAAGAVKGMRDSWTFKGFVPVEQLDGSTIAGQTAFLRWLWSTRLDDLVAAGLQLVAEDIRRGRSVPGLLIENERKAV